MRRFFLPLLSLCFALSPIAATAQTNGLAQSLLQASQAFSATGSVSSITLSGQVSRYAGSANENGTITLTARADGSSSLQMELASGQALESQDTFANGGSCSWAAPDGVSHLAAGHNCIVPVAWFLPEVALFSAALPANGAFSILSNTSGTATLLHWSMLVPTAANPDQARLLSHIGVYDLALDAATFLPASLSYASHPDTNAGVDIPVVVQYSDYRTVNGATIPYHIQRYFNGVLALDITLSNATVTY